MKKLFGLFFEDASNEHDGGKDGYVLVFVVWGVILLVNGISEYFIGNALIDNWFVILMIALVAFLLSEALGKKTSKESE